MIGLPHEYGPSRVGHGETQCIHCLGTNRENAIIAPNVCPRRPAPPMTQDIEKLVAELRSFDEEQLNIAPWTAEQTMRRAADALEALSRPGYAEGIEAAAKVAESWISSLRPGSIDRMNGQLEARREIASRIRALRDTNHA